MSLLADELARQQVAVHSLGVDLESVYDEIVTIDSAALEVDIELVSVEPAPQFARGSEPVLAAADAATMETAPVAAIDPATAPTEPIASARSLEVLLAELQIDALTAPYDSVDSLVPATSTDASANELVTAGADAPAERAAAADDELVASSSADADATDAVVAVTSRKSAAHAIEFSAATLAFAGVSAPVARDIATDIESTIAAAAIEQAAENLRVVDPGVSDPDLAAVVANAFNPEPPELTPPVGSLAAAVEQVAAEVAVVATELVDDLSDAWFVELDGLVASEDPSHVAYDDEPATAAKPRHPMRFVLVASALLLAVAACVGASV